MGQLVEGVWQDDGSRTKDGHFIRPSSSFRNFVTADGSAGPSGSGGFPAEAGRYHLYISLACPWAHRTLIFRTLKKLDSVISDVEHRAALQQDRLGIQRRARWHRRRASTAKRRSPKSICSPIRTIPAASRCRCCGTRSAKPSSTTNSSEIIRMLNTAFDAFTNVRTDYYPVGTARRNRPDQRHRLSDRQ